MKLHFFLLAALPVLLTAQAHASAPDRLKAFVDNLTTFQAGFVQTLYDADSQPIQESKGAVILKRPNKFRWDYRKPYVQSIVANGEKLWVYDVDLEQVSVKNMNYELGQTPIMLLSQQGVLEKEFDLQDLGHREGLDWIQLKPKNPDSDFEMIYMGLGEKNLEVMELRDQFGQATQIRFNNFEINVSAPDPLFEFTPPAGIDVVGQ